MPHTRSRQFVLPYEPQYTAHRTNSRVREFSTLMQHVHENRLHGLRYSVSPLQFAKVARSVATGH